MEPPHSLKLTEESDLNEAVHVIIYCFNYTIPVPITYPHKIEENVGIYFSVCDWKCCPMAAETG